MAEQLRVRALTQELEDGHTEKMRLTRGLRPQREQPGGLAG